MELLGNIFHHFETYKSLIWNAMCFALLVFFIISLARLHNNPNHKNFSLLHLIMDEKTDRVSATRVRVLIGLSVATWGFVFLTLNDKLSEWYFSGYMMAFIVDRAVTEYFTKKNNSVTLTPTQVNQIQESPPADTSDDIMANYYKNKDAQK